jgi:PKD repeat protein
MINPVSAFSGSGSGTEADPYQITDVNELQEMNDDLTAHYILMSDINASDTVNWNSGKGFEPIGDMYWEGGDLIDERFTGSLDGKNYTISNLYINRNKDNIGLFGSTFSSINEIKNIKLVNVDIEGRNFVGALIGSSDHKITNCHSSGFVESTQSSTLGGIGGLIGYAYSDVTQSSSSCNVDGYLRVGGLIGCNCGILDKSYSTGPVHAKTGIVGGLVGDNDGDSYNAQTIRNSYSSSDVSCDTTSEEVGGLVGRSNNKLVENCYSTGTISASNCGGLIGKNTGDVFNSYWDIDTSGITNSDGGTGLTTEEMETQSNFNNWNFFTVWEMPDNDYPVFRWDTGNWIIDSKIEIYSDSCNEGFSEGTESYTINERVPLTVNFDTPVYQYISSYEWHFGDGYTSNTCGQSPSHTYDQPGSYSVHVTAVDEVGDARQSNNIIIDVTEPLPEIKSMDITAPSGSYQTSETIDVTVTLTSSSGSVDNYEWFVDDSSQGTTVTNSNSLTITTDTSHNIKVIATNPSGNDSITESCLIDQTFNAPDITISPGGSFEDNTFFSNTFSVTNSASYVGNIDYVWKLDGSEIGTGTSQYVEISTFGNHELFVYANGEGGTDVDSVIIDLYHAPTADFTMSTVNGNAPLDIDFTSTSLYATSYNWNFGDGSTSTSENPFHTYSQPGTYTATLEVDNGHGATDSISKAITVSWPPLNPQVSANKTIGTEPTSIKFTPVCEYATDFSWDFGDGTTTDVDTPTHTYTNPGRYDIQITASNPEHTNTTTHTNYITIYGKIDSGFTTDKQYIYTGESIDFMDNSKNVTYPWSNELIPSNEWTWNFGDGFNSNNRNITHKYTEPGVYNVSLFVENDYSNDISYSGPDNLIYVHDLDVTPSTSSSETDKNVMFVASSSNLPLGTMNNDIVWEFSDGTTINGGSVIEREFQIPGTYSVNVSFDTFPEYGTKQFKNIVSISQAAPTIELTPTIFNEETPNDYITKTFFAYNTEGIVDEYTWYINGNTTIDDTMDNMYIDGHLIYGSKLVCNLEPSEDVHNVTVVGTGAGGNYSVSAYGLIESIKDPIVQIEPNSLSGGLFGNKAYNTFTIVNDGGKIHQIDWYLDGQHVGTGMNKTVQLNSGYHELKAECQGTYVTKEVQISGTLVDISQYL